MLMPAANISNLCFATQFVYFVSEVACANPLRATFGSHMIDYVGGNEWNRRQPPASLIEMPGLPPPDRILLRELRRPCEPLRSHSDIRLGGVNKQQGVFDLHAEVQLVQGVVNKAVEWASRLPAYKVKLVRHSLLCVDPLRDFSTDQVVKQSSIVSDLHIGEQCLKSAAILLGSSDPDHRIKAAEFLETAARYYLDTKWFYSAAALISEMAASAYESLAWSCPQDSLSMISNASMERKFAAHCWYESLRNDSSASDSSYDDMKLSLGIRNGLMYEAGFAGEDVDRLLAIAGVWHLANGRHLDAADDLMYLIYREMHRPTDEILPKRWRQIARTTLYTAFIWQKTGKAQDIIPDAIRLAGAAQAMGGSMYADLFEHMASLAF